MSYQTHSFSPVFKIDANISVYSFKEAGYFASESFLKSYFPLIRKTLLISSKCKWLMIHIVLYLNIKKVSYAFIHREICVNFKLLFTKS